MHAVLNFLIFPFFNLLLFFVRKTCRHDTLWQENKPTQTPVTDTDARTLGVFTINSRQGAFHTCIYYNQNNF